MQCGFCVAVCAQCADLKAILRMAFLAGKLQMFSGKGQGGLRVVKAAQGIDQHVKIAPLMIGMTIAAVFHPFPITMQAAFLLYLAGNIRVALHTTAPLAGKQRLVALLALVFKLSMRANCAKHQAARILSRKRPRAENAVAFPKEDTSQDDHGCRGKDNTEG